MKQNNAEQSQEANSNQINAEDSLKETLFCDCNHPDIKAIAEQISKDANNSLELLQKIFEYVRDSIHFGMDIYQVKASGTLTKGYGACWNKSLLLMALLRCKRIPSMLCSAPLKRTFIKPAIGKFYIFANEPFNHCFIQANINGKWIDLEPTLDQLSYNTFFLPQNVSWGISWNETGNNRLYTESFMGDTAVHPNIDETINNKVGNIELPKFLAVAANNWVNKKMWETTGGGG